MLLKSGRPSATAVTAVPVAVSSTRHENLDHTPTSPAALRAALQLDVSRSRIAQPDGELRPDGEVFASSTHVADASTDPSSGSMAGSQ